MLDFLGLEKEATTLVGCLIVIGISIGFYIGFYMSTKKPDSIFGKILVCVCTASGIFAVLKGFFPAVALFFLFQWGVILKGIFLAAFIGLIVAFIIYSIGISIRIRKYSKNPIMKEAVKFCKANKIVGVLCYKNALYFFSELPDTSICRSDVRTIRAASSRDADGKRSAYSGPNGLKALKESGSCVGNIIISQRGYPDIPDIKIFAKALAKKLGGCKLAYHHAQTEYESTDYNYATTKYRTITHFITHIYDEYFVFKRSAYRRTKKQENKEKRLQNKKKKEIEKKATKWE